MKKYRCKTTEEMPIEVWTSIEAETPESAAEIYAENYLGPNVIIIGSGTFNVRSGTTSQIDPNF